MKLLAYASVKQLLMQILPVGGKRSWRQLRLVLVITWT